MGRFTTRHNGYGRKGSMKVIHLSKPASVIFIIIGLAFVALGAYFAVNGLNVADGRVYTTALITKIEEIDHSGYYDGEYHYDEDPEHITHFRYVVNGEVIETSTRNYSSSFKEGKEVTIYYYPDNPYRFHTKGEHWLFAVAMIIFGAVFGIIGVVNLVKKNKKKGSDGMMEVFDNDNTIECDPNNEGYDSTKEYDFVD